MPNYQHLTNDDLIAIEREYCSKSLSNFIKRAWKQFEPATLYKHNWHIDCVSEHLEAVTNNDINRLLINIPPGCMKSSIAGVFHPLWEWGPKRLSHFRYITASHGHEYAIRDSMHMRRIVESPWFQTLWPLPLKKDQNEKTKFENAYGGLRQAMAVSSMTGARGHRIVWDDPLSVEGSLSEAERTRAIRIFKETLTTRLMDPEKSSITVVMQRLHQDDVAGHILANDYGYTHLCLPMEYSKKHVVPSEFYQDPRTKDGELLFPDRFPKHVVERDKKSLGPIAAAGQFDQNPSPRDGTIFRDEWWRIFYIPPANYIRKIQFWDCAQKPGVTNDYSVCATYIQTKEGLFLIDLLRDKWEAPDLERAAIEQYLKHKPDGIVIEDASAGSSLIQFLRRKKYPVIPFNPGRRDKVTRALSAVPSVAAGLYHLPDNAPWLSDFKKECREFGPRCSHDDMVDAAVTMPYIYFYQSDIADWVIDKNDETRETSLTGITLEGDTTPW
jgi:predicted phage terminase large subunit-like protein